MLPRPNGPADEARRLLASVCESIALNAAPVWADMALQIAVNRGKYLFAQRAIALRVARAYRTVSIAAVLVFARMIPWDLLAEARTHKALDENLPTAGQN
ncbi:hypothetical protein BIW11_02238 [Tropilaelaps mercedesae]|uniref:Uncharacterized protein n=1 Tax=Tropilaelaps mercedesae TaxID=418985 RepID=A0A1V9X1E2_9ACAR|nr:hypothetical protein BIW11_02238 [Tropilaelaps mercedesae]